MKLRNKKTGDIIETNGDANALTVWRGYGENPSYKSIEELLENWEDYEPKEPLIKDDKIRKAVRAWAEANNVDKMKVAPFAVFDIESTAGIYFRHRVIEDNSYDEFRYYTIPELCGEDEE